MCFIFIQYNITEEESFLKILIHVKHLAAIKQLKELREPSYER